MNLHQVERILCKPLIVLICLVFFLTCDGIGTETSLKQVSLLPQWIPQAQFAGYMVAVEKGFYRDAGLNLTLVEGGPGKPPFDLVASGNVTFCTEWLSNGIKKRSAGLQVVNLAQVIQKSSMMLVAKKKSGINSLKDLEGKKVGLWVDHFFLQPMVLFRKNNLKVDVILNYSSVGLFLKGGVDAMSAMWYNEYHTILNSGLNKDELTAIFCSEEGLNFPEDGLYCMEQTFRDDPEMCRAFAAASLRGWLYAFEHEQETLEIVMKYAQAAHTGTNKAHQRWMLARMKDLILSSGDTERVGKIRPADYELVGGVLKEFRLIDNLPNFDDFYRGQK